MGGNVFRLVIVLTALTLMPLVAHATIQINDSNAGTIQNFGTTATAYFPIIGTGVCAGAHTIPTTLQAIDASSGNPPGLQLVISPTKTLTQINDGNAVVNADDVRVHAEVNGQVVSFLNFDGSCTDSSCHYLAFGTTDFYKKPVAIKLHPSTADGFCNFAFQSTGGTCPQPGPSGSIQNGIITIGLAGKNYMTFAQDNTPAPNGPDTIQITTYLIDCPARSGGLTLPTLFFTLIPGDQRVKLANTSVPPADSINSVNNVVVFATNQGTQPTIQNTDPSQGGQQAVIAGAGAGVYTISGLTNDQQYCFSLGYTNFAGYVTTDATWTNNIATAPLTSQQFCATPSQIDGFLNRSTCFVASAAYGYEWDERLEVLRQFRDQILERSSAGRAFTQWYYAWSPEAAHWLYRHQAYRGLVRFALAPAVEGARAALWLRANLWVLGVTLVLGTALMVAGLGTRRRGAA
jgi:hypothetical protein